MPASGVARWTLSTTRTRPCGATAGAVLAGYGLGGQEIRRFDDSLLLSPTRQQLLEDAAA